MPGFLDGYLDEIAQVATPRRGFLDSYASEIAYGQSLKQQEEQQASPEPPKERSWAEWLNPPLPQSQPPYVPPVEGGGQGNPAGQAEFDAVAKAERVAAEDERLRPMREKMNAAREKVQGVRTPEVASLQSFMDTASKVPGVRGNIDLVFNVLSAGAAKRINAGEGTDEDFTLLAEIERMNAQKAEDAESRGFLGNLKEAALDTAPFMAGMALAAPMREGAKAAVKKAGGSVLAAEAASLAGGVLAPTMAPQTAKSAARYAAPTVTEHGDVVEGDGTALALAKGIGSTATEVASESLGELAGPAITKYAPEWANRIVSSMRGKEGTLRAAFADTLQAAGIQNAPVEWLEERATEIMQGGTGLEDNFGVTGQIAVGDWEPAIEQSLVELALFGGLQAPGAIGAVADTFLNRKTQQGANNGLGDGASVGGNDSGVTAVEAGQERLSEDEVVEGSGGLEPDRLLSESEGAGVQPGRDRVAEQIPGVAAGVGKSGERKAESGEEVLPLGPPMEALDWNDLTARAINSIRKRFPDLNEQDAEDLAQETMLRVSQTYDPTKGTPQALVGTILGRLNIDAHRKAERTGEAVGIPEGVEPVDESVNLSEMATWSQKELREYVRENFPNVSTAKGRDAILRQISDILSGNQETEDGLRVAGAEERIPADVGGGINANDAGADQIPGDAESVVGSLADADAGQAPIAAAIPSPAIQGQSGIPQDTAIRGVGSTDHDGRNSQAQAPVEEAAKDAPVAVEHVVEPLATLRLKNPAYVADVWKLETGGTGMAPSKSEMLADIEKARDVREYKDQLDEFKDLLESQVVEPSGGIEADEAVEQDIQGDSGKTPKGEATTQAKQPWEINNAVSVSSGPPRQAATVRGIETSGDRSDEGGEPIRIRSDVGRGVETGGGIAPGRVSSEAVNKSPESKVDRIDNAHTPQTPIETVPGEQTPVDEGQAAGGESGQVSDIDKLRYESQQRISVIDAELEATTKRLGSEKAELLRGRKKGKAKLLADLESQWEQAKADASQQKQEEFTKLRDAASKSPERAASAEKAKAMQAATDARIAEQAVAQQEDQWTKIQGAGGYEAVKAGMEADIRKLEGRIKATKPANRWKLESNRDRMKRDVDSLDKLNEKFGKSSLRQGEVGGKLASGEVVKTSSGRTTTPFPAVKVDTNRKATNTVRNVDKWLHENAVEEAKSRGDEYNATIFGGANPAKLSQADKDGMEEYLFGQQPDVPRPLLKPLVTPPPPSNKADVTATESVLPDALEKPKHDFSSTQVNLPEPVAKASIAASQKIADEDLAEDGRETEPHVTVKYGLHTNDAAEVRKLLESEPPIRVKLGKTSIFPASETQTQRGGSQFDVVKVDVESEDLRRLNAKISAALETTDTHPTYQPHVTLGYVKPGKGEKYVGMDDMAGQEMAINTIKFSGKDGNVVEIPLLGKRSGKPATEEQSGSIRTEPAKTGSLKQVGTRGQTAIPGLEEEAAIMEKKDAAESAVLKSLADIGGDDFAQQHQAIIPQIKSGVDQQVERLKKITKKAPIHPDDMEDEFYSEAVDSVMDLLDFPKVDNWLANKQHDAIAEIVRERLEAAVTSLDSTDTIVEAIDKTAKDPLTDAVLEAESLVYDAGTLTRAGEFELMKQVAEVADKYGVNPNEVWRDVYYEPDGAARNIVDQEAPPKNKVMLKTAAPSFATEAEVKKAYESGKITTEQTLDAMKSLSAKNVAPQKPMKMDGTVRPAKPVKVALPAKSIAMMEDAIKAKDAPKLKEMLHPSNKEWRRQFSAATGVKLPKTVKGTESTIASWAEPESEESPQKIATDPKQPFMGQWKAAKKAAGDGIVLFRVGDFYEMMNDDAKTVAKTLGLTLTTRDKAGADPIPMAGFPYHQLDGYITKLIKSGHRVAIVEQIDESGKPKNAEVTRIVADDKLVDQTPDIIVGEKSHADEDVQRVLRREQENGNPAWFDGSHFYLKAGKHEFKRDAKGRQSLVKLHDLSEGGIFRQFGTSEYVAYNRAAVERKSELDAIEKVKQDKIEAANKADREEAEARYKKEAAVDTELKAIISGEKLKGKQQTLPIKLGDGKTTENVEATVYGNLAIHKQPGKRPQWSVMIVPAQGNITHFDSKTDAVNAVKLLNKLSDWNFEDTKKIPNDVLNNAMVATKYAKHMGVDAEKLESLRDVINPPPVEPSPKPAPPEQKLHTGDQVEFETQGGGRVLTGEVGTITKHGMIYVYPDENPNHDIPAGKILKVNKRGRKGRAADKEAGIENIDALNDRLSDTASEMPSKPLSSSKDSADVESGDNAGDASTAKKKPDLKERAKAARQEMKDAADDLGDFLRGKTFSNPMLNPELVAKVAKLASKAVKAGTLTFAEFLADVTKAIGKERAAQLRPVLESEWNKASGEAESGKGKAESQKEESGTSSVPDATSIKNAVVDELRAQRGLPEMDGAPPQSQEEWMEVASQAMLENPLWTSELLAELTETPRNLSPVEIAALQQHYRALNNRFGAADEDLASAARGGDAAEIVKAQLEADTLYNQIEYFEEATKAAGREWGRSGVARQIVLARDYSLVGMMRKARVANGGNPVDNDKIRELANKVEELQDKLDKHIQEQEDADRERRVQQEIDKIKKTKPTTTVRKAAAAKRVDDAWANLMSKAKGKLFSTPVDIEVAAAGIELVRAYVDMGVVTFTEFMANVRKKVGDKAEKLESSFRDSWEQVKAQGGIPVLELDPLDLSSISRLAKQLQRALVESGVTERDAVVAAVHAELQEIIPDITERQTMDAMSGYGNFRQLSKDEIDVIIRDINGQLQQLGKLDDMEHGEAPRKTGQERREPTDEERRLIKKVNEAKKRGGYNVTDPAIQLKGALQAAKTAVLNQIADMTQEIEAGEKNVKSKTSLKADAELEQLRKQRDELRELHSKIFPKEGLTDEQKIKAAEKALDKAIALMEADIAAGDIGPKPKKSPLTSPALDAKRARLAALRAQRGELREAANPNARYKASLTKRLADWKQRIAEEDFAPRKRPQPKLDKEALAIKYEIEQEKMKFDALAEAYRRKRMTVGAKVLDNMMEVLRTTRNIMTGGEFSAVFRQGGFVTAAHPVMAAKALPSMFHAFTHKKGEFESAEEIRSRENYLLYKQAGLSITVVEGKLSKQEEATMSRWSKYIPGIAGSVRAYVTFINRIRADYFDALVQARFGDQGITLEQAKVLATLVNVATGRGVLGPRGDMGAVAAASWFFAPKFVVSRFQLAVGQPLWKGDLKTKRIVAQEYARAIAGTAIITSLLLLMRELFKDDDDDEKGYEFDPRSSDFGKIRIGNTRIDPLFGLSQTIVFTARVLSGQKKEASGEIVDLRGDNKSIFNSVAGTMGTFLRSKLAPAIGASINIAAGEDIVGEPATVQSEALKFVEPMTYHDIREAMVEQGIPVATATSMVAMFGMGASTYGDHNHNTALREILEYEGVVDAVKANIDNKDSQEYKSAIEQAGKMKWDYLVNEAAVKMKQKIKQAEDAKEPEAAIQKREQELIDFRMLSRQHSLLEKGATELPDALKDVAKKYLKEAQDRRTERSGGGTLGQPKMPSKELYRGRPEDYEDAKLRYEDRKQTYKAEKAIDAAFLKARKESRENSAK